jgi:hypothetical protein
MSDDMQAQTAMGEDGDADVDVDGSASNDDDDTSVNHEDQPNFSAEDQKLLHSLLNTSGGSDKNLNIENIEELMKKVDPKRLAQLMQQIENDEADATTGSEDSEEQKVIPSLRPL